MDGRRFDGFARLVAASGGASPSRRGFVGGLAALAAGLAGLRVAAAQTCPPGRVSRPRTGCVCRTTGRPPVGGVCPCPRGQADTGDGRGCLACRADGDCPDPEAPCLEAACGPTGECGVRPVGDGQQGGCPGREACLAGTCRRCGGRFGPCCAGAVTCNDLRLVCAAGTCRTCGSEDRPC